MPNKDRREQEQAILGLLSDPEIGSNDSLASFIVDAFELWRTEQAEVEALNGAETRLYQWYLAAAFDGRLHEDGWDDLRQAVFGDREPEHTASEAARE